KEAVGAAAGTSATPAAIASPAGSAAAGGPPSRLGRKRHGGKGATPNQAGPPQLPRPPNPARDRSRRPPPLPSRPPRLPGAAGSGGEGGGGGGRQARPGHEPRGRARAARPAGADRRRRPAQAAASPGVQDLQPDRAGEPPDLRGRRRRDRARDAHPEPLDHA